MAAVLFLTLGAMIFVPSRGHLRPEYPLLAALLFVLLLRSGLGILRRTATEQFLLFLFTACGLLSIISFSMRSDRFVYQDVLTLARGPVYGLILAISSSIAITERQMRSFLALLTLMAVAVVGISLIQYYNVGGLNAIFLQLYREDTALSTGSSYWDDFVFMSDIRRVIGTSGNPNDWGLILSYFGLFAVYRIIFERRLLWAPLAAGLMAAIITSGSRTAVVGLIGALGVGLAFATLYGRVRPAHLFTGFGLLVPVVLGGWLFYATQFQNKDRFTAHDLGSMQERLYLWVDSLRQYQSTLLLGQGPAKALRVRGSINASNAQVRDNVFVSFFVQFGVVGVAVVVALMTAMFRRLVRELRADDHAIPWWPVFMLSVFVAWVLFGMTADSFFANQVTYCMLLLYGITLAAPRRAPAPSAASTSPEFPINLEGPTSEPLPIR